MGTVVSFPEGRSAARDGADPNSESAIVIILPVVRVERYEDAPPSDVEPSSSPPGRKRRRRASRA
jgi:hypothetical protein